MHIEEDRAREIPLCRVVDRAQFKGWRREEVTLHRPYTAHLEVGQMPPWLAAIALQKKHHVRTSLVCVCVSYKSLLCTIPVSVCGGGTITYIAAHVPFTAVVLCVWRCMFPPV